MSAPVTHVVTEMLADLDWYADQFCEGLCEQAPEWAGFSDDVCAGCRARRTAAKARGLPYAKNTDQTPRDDFNAASAPNGQASGPTITEADRAQGSSE